MKRKNFFRLLTDYQQNRLDKRDRGIVDYWFAAIDRRDEVENTDISENEIKDKMWRQILAGRRSTKPIKAPSRQYWPRIAYIKFAAACTLILIATYSYLTFLNKPDAIKKLSLAETRDLIEISNQTTVEKKIILEDGSIVRLGRGASLYYPKHLGTGNERKVYLSGNAFFDVVKNPAKPFLVYLGPVATKVVGTSFTISKNENLGSIEVSVFSGKVIVGKLEKATDRENTPEQEVVLTPNKKVTFYEKENAFIPGLVDKPTIIKQDDEYNRPEAFKFEDVPLGKVIAKIEQAYGIEIITSDQSLKNCLISADLSDDNLNGKLAIISAALNAEFEIKGNVILLSGVGCESNQ